MTKLKLKVDQVSSKRKKETVAKTSSFHPAKEKRSSQSVENSNITKLRNELRNELLKQQQEKEIEPSYEKNQLFIDEATPVEAIIKK